MIIASRWPRRFEFALWVIGLTLLAFVAATTLGRWRYQAQQERALFERGPAVPAHNGPAVSAVATHEAGTVVGPPRAADIRADQAAAEAIAKTVHATERELPDDTLPPSEHVIAHPSGSEPTALGRLEIPRLGLHAIVADGSDERTLARAVGHLPSSALPGQLGNIVLAGHRDTFFWPLRDIEVNDRIRFVVPSVTYEYRVQSLRVVSPEETSVLSSNGTEQLTLVTCYPFTYIGAAPDRFVVVATRVN